MSDSDFPDDMPASVLPMRHGSATIKHPGTLLKHKSWLVMLAKAFPNLLTQSEHKISYQELLSGLGWSQSSGRRRLKAEVEALSEVKIKFNLLGSDDPDDWTSIHNLLAEVVDDKMGNFIYSFPPRLAKMLANPEIFSLLAMDALKVFRSQYALALYIMLNQYAEEDETPVIRIEDYREIVGIPDDKYREFKRLRQGAIDRPLSDLCKNSDLTAELKVIKNGKDAVGLQFCNIRRKENHELTEIVNAAKDSATMSNVIKKRISAQEESTPTLEMTESDGVYRLEGGGATVEKLGESSIVPGDSYTLLRDKYKVREKEAKELCESLDGLPEVVLRQALQRVYEYGKKGKIKSLGPYTTRTIRSAISDYWDNQDKYKSMQEELDEARAKKSQIIKESEYQAIRTELHSEYMALQYMRMSKAYELLPPKRKEELVRRAKPQLPPNTSSQLDSTKPIYALSKLASSMFLDVISKEKEFAAVKVNKEAFINHLTNKGFQVDLYEREIMELLRKLKVE